MGAFVQMIYSRDEILTISWLLLVDESAVIYYSDLVGVSDRT